MLFDLLNDLCCPLDMSIRRQQKEAQRSLLEWDSEALMTGALEGPQIISVLIFFFFLGPGGNMKNFVQKEIYLLFPVTAESIFY